MRFGFLRLYFFNFYTFSELVAGWVGVVKTPRLSTCIYGIIIYIIYILYIIISYIILSYTVYDI
jgi:hypothetical protein